MLTEVSSASDGPWDLVDANRDVENIWLDTDKA